MPSWSNLQQLLDKIPVDDRGPFIQNTANAALANVSKLTGRNAIAYASGFLQKPQAPGFALSVSPEDINGFMTCVHGMDCTSGLTLILHTPGGSAEAAETIVSYLWSKFPEIHTIIPTYCMSAGTMIAMASNRLIMGRQSQLGPTDPQLLMNGGQFSAHSIVEQFDEAKKEIALNPVLANAWAPVLQPFGPALLQEARKAVFYGQGLVGQWLTGRMLAGSPDPGGSAAAIATYFSGSQHGSHGHRIGREDARKQGLLVDDLEANTDLQDAALTLYHALTLAFENSPAAKIVLSSTGAVWMKNVGVQMVPAPVAP